MSHITLGMQSVIQRSKRRRRCGHVSTYVRMACVDVRTCMIYLKNCVTLWNRAQWPGAMGEGKEIWVFGNGKRYFSLPRCSDTPWCAAGLLSNGEYAPFLWLNGQIPKRTSHLHLVPRLLTHTLTHSVTHLLTHCITHTYPHALSHSLNHSVTQSLTHSLTQSLNHSLTQPLTHSITHSLTQSLTQSLTHTYSWHRQNKG